MELDSLPQLSNPELNYLVCKKNQKNTQLFSKTSKRFLTSSSFKKISLTSSNKNSISKIYES